MTIDNDIIFFDKDSTLGEFESFRDNVGLYPNVPTFLEAQRETGRRLYVATTAGDGGRAHLADIDSLFEGYFGRQQIDAGNVVLYVREDGVIRGIRDDYDTRISFESEERREALDAESLERSDRLRELPFGSDEKKALQTEIQAWFHHWHQLLHNETRKPFDDSNIYQNPNIDSGSFIKDLHLARRLISPTGYEQLRTVMVGDHGDRGSPASDPETPLIIISGNTRAGDWQPVSRMLDELFSDASMPTWQVYERMFAQSTPSDEKRTLSLGGVEFSFEKGEQSERRIYCK